MILIYKNQSALRIRVTIGVDITGAQQKLIKYQKPSGETGSWPATVESADQGIIYHDIPAAAEGQDEIIDETGVWKIWPWIRFADGRAAPGSPIEMKVLDEGVEL